MRRDRRELVRVRLYTRAGCHLCDDAKAELERIGVDLDEVDIDSVASLRSEFGERVPVIEVGGRIVAEGNVNGLPLSRLIRE